MNTRNLTMLLGAAVSVYKFVEPYLNLSCNNPNEVKPPAAETKSDAPGKAKAPGVDKKAAEQKPAKPAADIELISTSSVFFKEAAPAKEKAQEEKLVTVSGKFKLHYSWKKLVLKLEDNLYARIPADRIITVNSKELNDDDDISVLKKLNDTQVTITYRATQLSFAKKQGEKLVKLVDANIIHKAEAAHLQYLPTFEMKSTRRPDLV